MVTLEQFVTETLKQITDAASKHEDETGKPLLADYQFGANLKEATLANHGFFDLGLNDGRRIYASVVEFDVAITTDESSEAGGSANVKVLGVFNAEMKGSLGAGNSSVSRVKFKLPVTIY